MKRRLFYSWLFFPAVFFLSFGTGSCTSASGNAESHPAEQGELIFFDDFSGPGLDSTRWNTEITGNHVNRELQAYVDSSSVIRLINGEEAEGAVNGALQIKPVFSPGFQTADGRSFDFISGRINTRQKVEFSYGSASARIKLSDGAGLWPAWWLLGNGNWPESGEIDIMEYVGEKDWASAAVHGPGYSGDAALVNRLYFSDTADVTNWHVYAVNWTPDTILFSYDDIPVLRVTKPMTTFFGTWAFDSPKYLILNFAVGGVYPFKTNGIESPYYGLPASTFDRIKKGNCKMLVDWVKVETYRKR